MSRRAPRRWVRVSLWLALLTAACDDVELQPPAADAATPEAPRDAAIAAQDAQPPAEDAAMDAGSGDVDWQPPVIRPLPDSVCALAVGAQCDGSEDCAAGETCCGRFEPALFAYTSIACRAECSDGNDIELCHPADACAREENVCRTSLIIPHDFIGVCARPEGATRQLTGEAVAGEVACGATTCEVGVQKCCLRARYHFAAMSINALEPYCADVDDNCSCNHMPPVTDAGAPDGGAPDAGPPDAGPPIDEDSGT